MKSLSNLKSSFRSSIRAGLSLAAVGLATTAIVDPKEIYEWSMRVYAAQVGVLKMDWSGPQVFCTELSISYDPATRSCGKRGPLTHPALEASRRGK